MNGTGSSNVRRRGNPLPGTQPLQPFYGSEIKEDVTSGLKIVDCMAVTVIAICALVATVFLGIHVFHNEHGHHHDTTLVQEVLTKDSSGIDLIGNDVSDGCNDGVEIDIYRLERTGKHALLYVQGTCVNTTGLSSSIQIDLNMGNFPDRFRCPTGSSSDDAAVMGTGSATVSGSNISANVQIEANSNADEIDVDIDFTGTVPSGRDVDFSVIVSYDIGRC